MVEHSINDLGVMMQCNMKEFNVPLDQYYWCIKWCKNVHNVLAMRKLRWKSLKEVLTGDTPDISMFRFYIWKDIYYLDLDVKQPEYSLLPGKFLGIA